MEKLSVSYLNDVSEGNVKEVFCRMNTLERHSIGEVLWHESSLEPKVSFAIAYSDNCILLKYFVQENAIRVAHNLDNSPVHMDSCVEFFISFNEENYYYNLEFNSIGTCSFGFGKNSLDRLLIQQQDIGKIRRQALIESCVDKGISVIHWELSLVIPFEIFVFHKITSLMDVQCKANFYKCGDDLPTPHFLSWQRVISDTPNFHLPQFFGSLHFIKPCLS